jgi:FHS family L-fucose permease-like MFS transporter
MRRRGPCLIGKHSGQGSGILCMAIVSGAIVPVVRGAVAGQIGIHYGLIVTALCYVYIAWYALRGTRGHAFQAARRPDAPF